MNPNNENGLTTEAIVQTQEPEQAHASVSPMPAAGNGSERYVPKTDKQQPAIKRSGPVLLAGGIAVALVLFALSRIPHQTTGKRTTSPLNGNQNAVQSAPAPSAGASSILPVTDTARPQAQTGERNSLVGEDIARTAKQRPQPSSASNLSGVAPFNNQQQPWEPSPYQPNAPPAASDQATEPSETRNERDGLDKPSIVFVKNAPASAPGTRTQDSSTAIDLGIGLPPGTRLRARLESAVSTAVATPVVAVVEYNYERHGEIVVPAGAKVFGHLEAADGSGYVGVRFDSVMMPDGTSVSLEAAATDLQLRPLRGRVEGRHRGKNILVRSVSGIGEIAATRPDLSRILTTNDVELVQCLYQRLEDP